MSFLRNAHATSGGDTIAAISTPQGVGAIGIVRISGPDALKIADRIFKPASGTTPSKAASHTVLYGNVHSAGVIIDEVLLTVMKAPRTFTTEDMVEISGHGGVYSLRKILQAALKSGARMAEPGEFTKRAFVNGRIDLSQAESVIDLINAETEAGLDLAIGHLKGELSRRVRSIRDRIMGFYAPIEAAIDFPEEETELINRKKLRDDILSAQKAIAELLKSSDDGRRIRKGISVAIAGRPNAGKSSLFNLFSRENRAIVTHIPGTTRDLLEENIVINGVLYLICDTAGLRRPRGLVEKIGIEQTRKRVEESDIVIYLIDNRKGPASEDMELIKSVKETGLIVVLNKIDKKRNAAIEKSLETFDPVRISVKEKRGITELKDKLGRKAGAMIPARKKSEAGGFINDRQYKALISARQSLENAAEGVRTEHSIEFIAMDIKAALSSVGEITGENVTEGTLQEIFSRFCIGK